MSVKRQREMKEREKELRDRFAQLLADDMIDLPEDYYEENLYARDGEQPEVDFITGSAESVFSQLENKNLDRIIETQDTEQQYEENRREFEEYQHKTKEHIDSLVANK